MRGTARGFGIHQGYEFLCYHLVSILSVFVLLGPSASASTERAFPHIGTAGYGYDLIAYIRLNSVEGPLDEDEADVPKYDRLKHFGGWKVHTSNDRCSRTRELVLFRQADSQVPVNTNEHCRVLSGRWADPYTGHTFTNPLDLQIDHVVPLRHAYYAGAHNWRPAERCHYANFIGNSFHLMAVSGRENMSKGDKSPQYYMPPNPQFQCEYLSNWMKIKIIWRLWSSTSEVRSIENRFATANCPAWMRYISIEDLRSQREAASQPIRSCHRFEQNQLDDEAMEFLRPAS